jgi:hypothetical protein
MLSLAAEQADTTGIAGSRPRGGRLGWRAGQRTSPGASQGSPHRPKLSYFLWARLTGAAAGVAVVLAAFLCRGIRHAFLWCFFALV